MNHAAIVLAAVLVLASPEENPAVRVFPLEGGSVEVFAVRAEGRFTGVTAKGEVDAPAAVVWDLLADYDHAGEIMPTIKNSETIRREGRFAWTRTMVGMGPLNVEMTTRMEEDREGLELRWEQEEGPFTVNRGVWSIRERGDKKCLLVYSAEMDHPLFPDWLREELITRSVPEMFQAIRKRAFRE